uniref:52kDa cement protein n=1 Tax=Megabalanus rosa TaxID=6680 RepID=G9M908_MEGRO|nr:52kDa cement protein [Megabalanus rosa]
MLLRPVLLLAALAALAAATGSRPYFPVSSLKPVLSGIGLPAFYKPDYALSGLVGYLNTRPKIVTQAQFTARIQKYAPVIKRIVLPMRRKYSGILGDLIQVAVIRYYGCEPVIGSSIHLDRIFGEYIKRQSMPSPYKYNAKYVTGFIRGFMGYMHKNYKPSQLVVPVVKPTYPGYGLLTVLQSVGLPALTNPRMSLGGVVAYLQLANIQQAVFISRIRSQRKAIRRLVSKYRSRYSGVQLDLLCLAALRYYGVPRTARYVVDFDYALEHSLKSTAIVHYNPSYVRTFLSRFSTKLVTLPYPGYDMITIFRGFGLPKLYQPRYTLGGLVSYLKVAKISQPTFIGQIKKYAKKIKKFIRKYKKKYSGYRSDLLQLAAIRYCLYPRSYPIKFSTVFQRALSSYSTYSVSSVSSFLGLFTQYLKKPAYVGYNLKPVLLQAGLPKLSMPQYSLSGLMSYIHGNKYSDSSLIGLIRVYGPKIKRIVHQYKSRYSGIQADLLQLCAIRYYSLPVVFRSSYSFGTIFQQYLGSQNLKVYNASTVKRFINGFVSYIRKRQSNKYSGPMWVCRRC